MSLENYIQKVVQQVSCELDYRAINRNRGRGAVDDKMHVPSYVILRYIESLSSCLAEKGKNFKLVSYS